MTYFCAMVVRRAICILMALLLLAADSGQMLFAHTCLKSKQTSFSLSNGKDCCHKEAAVAKTCTIGKSGCCETTATYLKQSLPGSFKADDDTKVQPKVFTVTQLFSVFIAQHISVAIIATPLILPAEDNVQSFIQVFRC